MGRGRRAPGADQTPGGAGASGWTGERRLRRSAAVRRWVAVVDQSVRDLRAIGALELAAALAFYGLVSLFPLLLAGAVVATWFADPAWAVERITDLLGAFVPRGEVEVEEIVDDAVAERGRVGLLSVLVLVLSGRRVLGALTSALNRVSDVDERSDSVARRAIVELVLLAGLAGLFGLALSAGPLLAPFEGVAGWAGTETALRALLLLATFSVIYAVVPRGARDRRAVLVGAGAATALFLLARWLFLLWVGRLWESLSLIYGPLAVAAMLLLWAWYVALITLFGGALASHAKVMVFEGQSAAAARQRHLAGEAAEGGAARGGGR